MLPSLLWISPGRGLGEPLYQRLATCVRAGLRGFQLREKLSFPCDILAFAERAQQLLAMRDGLVLVNDRVDIARAVGCGVHLGSRSLSVQVARSVLAPDQPIGTIALDALFSPVTNVTFKVENTRVGHKTDFERLIPVHEERDRRVV